MKTHDHPIDTLQKEMDWFAAAFDHIFESYFEQTPADLTRSITPPDLSRKCDRFATVVNDLKLDTAERLVLMLALTPHLKPNLLDVFFTKNAHFDRVFTEFGGTQGKSHTGYLPTGETAAFLLHNGSLDGRIRTLGILSSDHAFAQHDILRLEEPEPHEPRLSGRLVVSRTFLDMLLTGRDQPPATSDLFPARRITTALAWEDLVLPATVKDEISQIRLWIECQQQLMQCGVFRKHVKPGFRSLFYGPPGTGKTLSACLLGKVTGLDIYRIDLSLVVSKYIGETEKNLSRIFDHAEKRNWIIFFDEADALFGKRTQTSSSNDRYANQEVSYLLQRIEDFPGIVILASNLKSNIDEAFSRRFQSVVYFPMPDASQRLALWTQAFSGTIHAGPDFDFGEIAAKYELSGGSIINVLRYAALQASANKTTHALPEDILQGIRKEFQKYGRTL